MRYFVYAYPACYTNAIDMHEYEIADDVSYEGAIEDGLIMANDIICDYMRPEEQLYTREDFVADHFLDEWDDEYEEQYYACLDEEIADQCACDVYEIKENTTDEDIRNLEQGKYSAQEFIKKFCKVVA